MSDDFDDDGIGDEWDGSYDDDYGEPIGSCDECGTNLYEDDCYIHQGDELCGQCYWWATEALQPH